MSEPNADWAGADWSDFETLALGRNRIGAAVVLQRMAEYTTRPFLLCQVAQFVTRRIVESNEAPSMARFRYVRSRDLRGTTDDAYELVSLYLTGDADSIAAAERVARRAASGSPNPWWYSRVVSDLLDLLPTSDLDVFPTLRGRVE